MDRQRFLRVKDLFQRSRSFHADARSAFLAAECAGDEALRAEVEDLLAHAASAGSGFLDGARDSEVSAPRTLEIPGFEIVDVIAAGGAGVVYRARQSAPQRDVAIKVLRLDTLGSGQVRRFRREAEILGTLNHPGIAHVYGAGVVSSGSLALPWIAMELVHGVPLDAYLAESRPEMRALLVLFRDLCAAVDHAHGQGVVHRDLKPSNVLVESGGRPRVLDFGVALVVGAYGDPAQRTRTGALVGTLAYMAPEQARGDRQAIDARADVYALGVMLHEALTGRMPLELDGLDLIESARIVCEVEPERISRARPGLPVDLDAIVGKALEKEPGRRYARAGEMAADIENLLADRPVRARRPTTIDQARKFVRRNRVLTITTSVVVLVLAAALGVTLVALRSQARERAIATETLDFLASRMTAFSPQLGFGEAQREDLEEVDRRIGRQLVVDPRSRPLRSARARVLYEIASLDQARADFEPMRARLDAARELREELAREDTADTASLTHLSQICAKLGEAWRDLGHPERRDEWFARALEIDMRLVCEHPGDPEYVEDLGWSLERVAQIASERGDHAEARRLTAEWLADAERLVARDPDNWKFAFSLSHAHYFLGTEERLAGRADREVFHALECAQLARRVRDLVPSRRDFVEWSASAERRAADVLKRAQRLPEARLHAEKALSAAEELGLGDPRRSMHLDLVQRAAIEFASPDLGDFQRDRAMRAASSLRRVADVAARAGATGRTADLLASAAAIASTAKE